MLYVINQCKSDEKLGGLGIHLSCENDTTVVSLCGKGQNNVPILSSVEKGIGGSIRKSINYIGKKTGTIKGEQDAIFAALFDDKPSEISIYIKGSKISLEPSQVDGDNLVVVNSIADDAINEEKRYPKDIIVVATDKRDGKLALRCDKRNIVGKPIVVTGEVYDVIMFIPKWPTWATLKFPAYFSVVSETTGENNEKNRDVVCAIKLGSRKEKDVVRNQVDMVDPHEADEYLAESERLLNERNMKLAVDRMNKKNGAVSAKNGNNKTNNGGANTMAKGKNNKNGNPKGNGRTGVPSMYGNKGNGTKGNGTKPAQGGNKKNFRKNGNR